MKLKDVPIFYKAGVCFILGTVFVLTYHEPFITGVEAKEMVAAGQTKNAKAIKANTAMLIKHLEDYEMDKKRAARNDIAGSIQGTQDTQMILRAMVSFHEENALTEQTETTLGNRLTSQQKIEGCLMTGGDNCVAESP